MPQQENLDSLSLACGLGCLELGKGIYAVTQELYICLKLSNLSFIFIFVILTQGYVCWFERGKHRCKRQTLACFCLRLNSEPEMTRSQWTSQESSNILGRMLDFSLNMGLNKSCQLRKQQHSSDDLSWPKSTLKIECSRKLRNKLKIYHTSGKRDSLNTRLQGPLWPITVEINKSIQIWEGPSLIHI